jgi:hypothetical protein
MFKRIVKRIFASVLIFVGAIGLSSIITDHFYAVIIILKTLSCLLVVFVGGWIHDTTEDKD